MAADLTKILENLTLFYNFNNKTVAHVGVGGGALIGYLHLAEKIYAIDNDEAALLRLKEKVKNSIDKDKFTYICNDFNNVQIKCDVVFFEFCLHEIEYPMEVLNKARGIADEIVVIDHALESKWSWYTCETEKLERSWNAINKNVVEKEERHEALQNFTDYNDLYNRVNIVGDECIKRIEELKSKTDIVISMPYKIVLLSK